MHSYILKEDLTPIVLPENKFSDAIGSYNEAADLKMSKQCKTYGYNAGMWPIAIR